MKLVRILWDDAMSEDSGWKSVKSVRHQKPLRVKSVGWVVKRTKSYVTLVSSRVDGVCDGDVVIPRGMIVREDVLVVKGKK